MVNRERFMLDLDSEGFPIPNHAPFHNVLAAQRIGKVPSTQMAQGLLADAKCLSCPTAERSYGEAVSNMDGITRLSDSYAPDAYFGHKR